MADDLWPENIAESNLVTPVSILKEQAALLGEKTKQLVKGEVQTTTVGNLFVHHFYLVAPTLNYRYQLFEVEHPLHFYPLGVRHLNMTMQISSEDDLRKKLREIFAAPQTVAAVQSILAQVRS